MVDASSNIIREKLNMSVHMYHYHLAMNPQDYGTWTCYVYMQTCSIIIDNQLIIIDNQLIHNVYACIQSRTISFLNSQVLLKANGN